MSDALHMLSIKTLLVMSTDEELEVLPFHQSVTIDGTADNALESVRRYFRDHWAAEVHALRWICPSDLRIDTGDQRPVLVLHVNSPGRISRHVQHRTEPVAEPIILEAQRACPYQPWSEPLWLENVSAWLRAQLGQERVKRISQIRVTSKGAVLRVQATPESFFMKVLPSFFSYEPKLIALLNRRLPAISATLLPLKWDDNTHFTWDIGEHLLMTTDDLGSWSGAMTQLAQLQISSAACTEEIRTSGTPYRDFGTFSRNVANLVSELAALQLGSPNQLSEEELGKLLTLSTLAKRECELLAQHSLPDTLVHGDCGEHNILLTKQRRIKLIDWSLSRVSHPFFMMDFFAELYPQGHPMCGLEDRLIDSYLREWESYATLDDLRVALKSALRICPIEMAVNAADYIEAVREQEPSNRAFIAERLRTALLRCELLN
jgi:Phosphotransferase enzyme family